MTSSRARFCLAVGFLVVCFSARPAAAKDFGVSRQWLFDARADDLLAVILGYDQACDHGCRYRAPHVTQALVLSHKRTRDDFFVWTFVEDVQNTTFFSHVTVKRDRGRIQVMFRLVGPKRAAELTQASSKPHDPNFDDSLAVYELDEVFEAGRFRKTRVHYQNTLVLTGFSAVFGASVVRDRLEEDARFTYEILHGVKLRAEAAEVAPTLARPDAGEPH